MTEHLAPAPPPSEAREADRYEGLPDDWSLSARETYAQVSEDNPGLSSAALATLYEAAALLAMADAMADRVAEDGLMVEGSRGQQVPHGLIPEVRHARAQAIAALRALGIAPGQSSASAAGSTLVNKRWNRNHGKAATR